MSKIPLHMRNGIGSLFELVLNPKLHSLKYVLLCFLWFPLKLVVGPELLDPQVGRHDLVTQVLKQFGRLEKYTF